jgi:cytochrome c oxidase subunit IV
MSAESHEVHHDGGHEGMTKKKIWQIALVLSIITAIEFIIALGVVPGHPDYLRYANPAYIFLTLLKAFFIVAYFMHLKFEKMGLVLAIIVPILFIVGLILVLTNESHHWITLRG